MDVSSTPTRKGRREAYWGSWCKDRIIEIIQGGKTTFVQLFSNKIDHLMFNLIALKWKDGKSLLQFSRAQGRKLHSTKLELYKPIQAKWSPFLLLK